MTIKLVFSDIDGTLLNSRHQISEQTAAAVNALAQQGIPFILVSARMPSGIIPIQEKLGNHDAIVCYGGALVLDAPNERGKRRILENITMDTTTVLDLYGLVCKRFPSVSFCAYSLDDWLVPSTDDPWIQQEQAIAGTIPEPFHFADDDLDKDFPAINKVLCMGEPGDISELQHVLKEQFSDVALYQSKPAYLEITSGTAGKSSAIDTLVHHYGVKKEETLAFGDNYNDVDMLRAAGVGIAMGNAPDEVKSAADQVTATNDQDGLKKGLEAFGLTGSAT